jgi:hypothetical protein
MGGDQRVPDDVTHIRIHKSVKRILYGAFQEFFRLVSVEMHDGVEIIEGYTFCDCISLKGIKLAGVRVIGAEAFSGCRSLTDVEFGDKLETIDYEAFLRCTSLSNIKIPKVRVIGNGAFEHCNQLTEVKLSKDLEAIGYSGFHNCHRLSCIAMPLKANLFEEGDHVFRDCHNLSQVDVIGSIHKTISSLLLDRWRNDMNDDIHEINQLLPNSYSKTVVIRRWMGRVLNRITRYKSEHYTLLKNNMTLLELALWKSNLPNVDAAASRHEARITCGANIIIPHVLSFLNNNNEFPLLGV